MTVNDGESGEGKDAKNRDEWSVNYLKSYRKYLLAVALIYFVCSTTIKTPGREL